MRLTKQQINELQIGDKIRFESIKSDPIKPINNKLSSEVFIVDGSTDENYLYLFDPNDKSYGDGCSEIEKDSIDEDGLYHSDSFDIYLHKVNNKEQQ